MAAGYQSFVAWRYLMARPRKVSVAIMIFVGVCLVTAGVLFYIARITHNMYVSMGAGAVVAVAEFMIVVGILRYFFSFFTTVSMAGCMVGAQAMVVVLSVMSGFETDLRSKILGMNAHIRVTKEKGDFADYREAAKEISALPDVVGTTPYVQSEVVIAANKNYSNVIIRGIDPKSVSRVTDLGKNAERPRALERLWPVADDGGILGPPADAGVIDESAEPIDFSGGVDAGPIPDARPMEDASRPTGPPSTGPPGPPPAKPPPGAKVDPADEPLSGGAIDTSMPPAFPRLEPDVARLDGILVGKELRKHINLYVGQQVEIVSPTGKITPEGVKPNVVAFRIAGTFYTGMYEYDLKFVYVDIHALQHLLGLGDIANGIEIRVKDPDKTGEAMNRIREVLGPGYRLQDWKEINRNLFSALKLEKMVMFLVLAIIILVASFSIIGNLIMVVVEKATEIALLKTLGSSDAQVRSLFIIQGFFIGLIGTTLGVLHGTLAAVSADAGGVPLSADVYYINKVPIHIEPSSVVAVFVAGIVISVVATIYPAYIASRLRPIDGMRYE